MLKKNNAFTLIELMVVIVIIGVLAAIAVPKLFSMSAKAKAAEVGPASGSWSKLVHVYFAETGSFGNWASIGYVAPGVKTPSTGVSNTTFIRYQDPDFGLESTISRWEAVAKKISETCDGQVWSLESNGNAVSVKSKGCADLTPNFDKIQ